MKTVFFAAAAAAVAISAPAFAQEAASFNGPRAEVLIGYDAVDTGSSVGTPDGFAYGLGIGYDKQFGRAVVGIEGEVSDSTVSRAGVKSDRDLYAGARLGYAIDSSTLLYAKVGYTNARFETAVDGSNFDGVRVGGGIEYNVRNNVFVKGEYRYSNYEADLQRHQVVGGVGIRF